MERKRRMRSVTVVKIVRKEKRKFVGDKCAWGGGGQANGEKEEVRPFVFMFT